MEYNYDDDFDIFLEDESVSEGRLHCNIAHKHNGIELIYTLRGKMKCQVGDEAFILTKGDICFVNKNQLHQLSCINKDDCNHKTLIIDMKLLTQNSLVFEKYLKPLIEENNFSHVRFEGQSSPAALISYYIEKIDEAKKERGCGYELDIIGLLHQIVRQIYIAYSAGSNIKQGVNQHAIIQEEMVSFIEDNFGEQITLDDIADAGNVSRSQCIKIFKEYTGQPPISFLNSFRINASRSMLRNSSDSIADISMNCGFNGQSYFNRLFLRANGCTPNEYRMRKEVAS